MKAISKGLVLSISVAMLVGAFSAAPASASLASLCTVFANGPTEPEDKTCVNAGGKIVSQIKGTNVGAAILTASIEIKCTESSFKAQAPQSKGEAQDSVVQLKVHHLSFTGCTTEILGEKIACTIGETEATGLLEEGAKDEEKPQKGPLAIKGISVAIKCGGTECKVTNEAGGVKGTVESSGAAEAFFKKAPVAVGGNFLCGTKGTETVTYKIDNNTQGAGQNDHNVWFASDGLEV
jgi:hypothetical protein